MRFLHPEYAVWLAAVPLVWVGWLVHARARRAFARRAASAPIRQASRLTSSVRDVLTLVCATVAVAAAALALLRPQWLTDTALPEFEREDLVVILDHSASMRARDVQPSRFERAVAELKTFLRQKPDVIDRVGLVEFSGASLILSHLSHDVDSLSFYLDWISETPDIRFGTDMGAALAMARSLTQKDDKPTRKVFLVISDGADQGITLAKELAIVRDERTRVYAIGIGADPESLIPVTDELGIETPLEDDDGKPLKAGFDESSLRELAAQTGGRYVRSTGGAEISVALADLVTRERRLLTTATTRSYRDLYPELLAASALAAACWFVLL